MNFCFRKNPRPRPHWSCSLMKERRNWSRPQTRPPAPRSSARKQFITFWATSAWVTFVYRTATNWCLMETRLILTWWRSAGIAGRKVRHPPCSRWSQRLLRPLRQVTNRSKLNAGKVLSADWIFSTWHEWHPLDLSTFFPTVVLVATCLSDATDIWLRQTCHATCTTTSSRSIYLFTWPAPVLTRVHYLGWST